MKPKKNKKATPEEALRASCEAELGVHPDYARVRENLDVEAIARAGAAKQMMTVTALSDPTRRRSVAATVCLVLAVLVLIPAVAVGSFVIARMTMGDEPPAVEPPADTNNGMVPPLSGDSTTVIPPVQSGPHESATGELPPEPVGNGTLDSAAINVLAESLFDLSSSYATKNILTELDTSLLTNYALFLRMDHLPAEGLSGDMPATLWVEDYDLWEGLFPNLSGGTYEDYSVLDVSLRDYNSMFFEKHSLLILFTEGRSGSVRYRIDELKVNREYVKTTLTVGVPAANTMDIAHWCIIIPVGKSESGETNRPVYLETREVPMDSFEEFVTIAPEVYRGLWFQGSIEGSYERDGYLYGRIDRNREKQSWEFPRTHTVTAFEEWRALYGGMWDSSMHKGFYEGIRSIDEDFFAEKSLVIAYVEEPSGSIHHRVDGVTAAGGSLAVKIISLYAGGSDDVGVWAIIIPIDKELDSLSVTLELTEQSCTWEEYEAWPEWQDWEEWSGD